MSTTTVDTAHDLILGYVYKFRISNSDDGKIREWRTIAIG
jgi:hypothetical protein